MSIDPGKYTVIKTADLEAIISDVVIHGQQKTVRNAIAAKRKDGATVILPEDLFAGPALHGYAAGIGVALNLLPPNHPDRPHLDALAQYFHDQALEADEKGYKVPDDD